MNKWLATVTISVDWTCVCGKAHQVSNRSDTNVLVCPECKREWKVRMGNTTLGYEERKPEALDGQMALFGAQEQKQKQDESAKTYPLLKPSKALERALVTYSKYYPIADVIVMTRIASDIAKARGGREITVEDWNNATDEDGAPRMVATHYLSALEKLYS